MIDKEIREDKHLIYVHTRQGRSKWTHLGQADSFEMSVRMGKNFEFIGTNLNKASRLPVWENPNLESLSSHNSLRQMGQVPCWKTKKQKKIRKYTRRNDTKFSLKRVNKTIYKFFRKIKFIHLGTGRKSKFTGQVTNYNLHTNNWKQINWKPNKMKFSEWNNNSTYQLQPR